MKSHTLLAHLNRSLKCTYLCPQVGEYTLFRIKELLIDPSAKSYYRTCKIFLINESSKITYEELIHNLSWSYCCVYITIISFSQSCPTLCDPTDCSPLGFSVWGIFLGRILKWVAISSSRGSSWSRDWTRVSRVSSIGRKIFFYHLLTWESPLGFTVVK